MLPLLGVIMTEDQFAMVSEWMANSNIKEYIAAHQDVNRLELVSVSFRLWHNWLSITIAVTPIVSGCREGISAYARSGDGSRRS